MGVSIRYFFIVWLLITVCTPAVYASSLPIPILPDTNKVLSPDTSKVTDDENAIKAKIHYSARDSIRLDMNNQKVYLFGEAKVDYETTSMTADYLEVDLHSHIVIAKGRMDSTKHLVGKPVVKEGDKSFSASEMHYNYVTKKGKIYEIITQEGDGKILGEAVKKDSNNVYFIANGRYSTCNLDEPHFDILAHKLKVIPNDKIITGPAQLQVMGISTPLLVPFGFFPNKKGRKSGIIIPTYGESQNQGFFLRDGGYYFGISDHVDLALKGDIYSHGSYGVKVLSNYKTRYEYYGNVNIGFAKTLIENSEYQTSQNNFFVRWTHFQDPKSNPSSRFSANVNAGTSNYNSLNSYRPSDYLTNTFQSNISWNKAFVGTPFNLSTNLRHNQNTITKQVDLSLPDVALTMNRIYPFKSKEEVSEKWWDKIGISATMNAANKITSADSLLFKSQTLKQMRNGFNTIIPISATLRTNISAKEHPLLANLNRFNFTPAVNITDNVYFKTIRKEFDPVRDSVKTDTVGGARNSLDYNVSTAISTKIYGKFLYQHGPIKAIQHVMTPTVSFIYKPDFGEDKYGYYKTVQTNNYGATTQYSIFQNGIYGGALAGKQEMVAFALNNNLAAKLRSKSDTAKKDPIVSIIDNLNINTAFNQAAEHFKWSPITVSGQTQLFKKKLTVNAGTTLDPYMIDASGTRIEKFEIRHNNRIGRLTNANLTLTTALRSKDKNGNKPKVSTAGSPQELEHINANPNAYIDFNVRWTLMLSYDLRFDKGIPAVGGGIQDKFTQTLRFNGDCNLTQKWKVGFNSGYDLKAMNFSYTSINVYRDLHCWEMAFNWIPFGIRQSYSVDIKVKSAVLQDLKLSRKREWYDYTY